MPRLPAILVPAVRRLEADLRHAPRETLLRDVERIEELAADIDPAVEYPRDWIVFRVTGFRPGEEATPSADSTPETVRGDRLLADLSSLAERLCVRARLSEADLTPGAFIRASAVAKDWRASPATMKRWRKAGLVSRRVRAATGREEVWVSRLCAEAFRARNPAGVARAEKFERLTPQQRADTISRANSLRSQGKSLHQAAVALAKESGRSVEGVRHLLRTADTNRAPAKRERNNEDRRRAALLRLWRKGVDPSRLARLARRSVPLTRRDINLARAALLRSWLSARPPEALHPPDPASLQHLASTTGLAAPWESTLAEALAGWRARPAETRVKEHARATAYHTLRAQAAEAARKMPRLHPGARPLDQAETALRWASVLLRDLVRSQHRLILETLETRAGARLDALPPATAVQLLRAGVAAAADALDQFDPAKGGRFAGPVALAVDRAAVRLVRSLAPSSRSRATTKAEPPTPLTFPPLRPWEKHLLPSPTVVAGAPHIDRPLATLLAAHFGHAQQPPRTLEAIRAELKLSSIAAAHALQRALAAAHAAGAARF